MSEDHQLRDYQTQEIYTEICKMLTLPLYSISIVYLFSFFIN